MRPSWAASQPGSSRSSVPALPTSIGAGGLARLAQARAADHHVILAHLDQRAERTHRLERGVGVGGVQIALDPHRLGGHRPEQGGAMGDRLVGRCGQLAGEAVGTARSACSWGPAHASATGKPRPAISPRARRACSSPRIHSAIDPLAVVLGGRQGHVDDVDARRPRGPGRSPRSRPAGSGTGRPQLVHRRRHRPTRPAPSSASRSARARSFQAPDAPARRPARATRAPPAGGRQSSSMRVDQRVAVGHVDVGPDRRVGARHARCVAEARPDGRQPLGAPRPPQRARPARRAGSRARAAGARRRPSGDRGCRRRSPSGRAPSGRSSRCRRS